MKTEKIQMTFDIEKEEKRIKVGLAYCYATEIAFYDYTGQNFDEFVRESKTDSKRILYTILAAMMAYYQAKGEDAPITDADLMYHARPESIVAAFSTVIKLYGEWYRMPQGEQLEKEGDDSKNVKTPAMSTN